MYAMIRSGEYKSANPSHFNGELKDCLMLLPTKCDQEHHPEDQVLYRRVGFWCATILVPHNGPSECPDCDYCTLDSEALKGTWAELFPPTEEEMERERAMGFSLWRKADITIV